MFQNDIRNNPDIEIIRLKHGYIIFYWDDVEHSYYHSSELIQSPEKLYEILNKEFENSLIALNFQRKKEYLLWKMKNDYTGAALRDIARKN